MNYSRCPVHYVVRPIHHPTRLETLIFKKSSNRRSVTTFFTAQFREKITRYRIGDADNFGAKKLEIFLRSKKLQRLREFCPVQVHSPLLIQYM